MVEGRIQNRSWDAPDGTKKYRSEIVADRVQFGPKAGGSGGPPSASGGGSVSGVDTGSAGPNPADPIKTIQYPDEEINPADIPF